MSSRNKRLLIASIVTYFLPIVAAATFFIVFFSMGYGIPAFFIPFIPLGLGILLFLLVPLYKKHYYETKGERVSAIITTVIQCGAPMLMDAAVLPLWVILGPSPIIPFLKFVGVISYIPFLVLNILYWVSLKEMRKEEA
ncbi:MAG: hypothetical protein K6G74_01285 [Bacilli bacterium]|nr:hypothetical protein [Bacilli bacterium]